MKIIQIIPAQNWFARIDDDGEQGLVPLVCWSLHDIPDNTITGMIEHDGNVVQANTVKGFAGYEYAEISYVEESGGFDLN